MATTSPSTRIGGTVSCTKARIFRHWWRWLYDTNNSSPRLTFFKVAFWVALEPKFIGEEPPKFATKHVAHHKMMTNMKGHHFPSSWRPPTGSSLSPHYKGMPNLGRHKHLEQRKSQESFSIMKSCAIEIDFQIAEIRRLYYVGGQCWLKTCNVAWFQLNCWKLIWMVFGWFWDGSWMVEFHGHFGGLWVKMRSHLADDSMRPLKCIRWGRPSWRPHNGRGQD